MPLSRNDSPPPVETDRGYATGIIAAGVVLAILYWARPVFITTIVAVIIALILEPFVGLLTRVRVPRAIASGIVCLVAVAVLYFVGRAVWYQMSAIVSDVPALKERLTDTITGISDQIQHTQESVGRVLTPTRKPVVPVPVPQLPVDSKKYRGKPAVPTVVLPLPPELIPEVRIHEDRNVISDYVVQQLPALYQYLLMASFVPLLVYFMLSWRDHLHRSFLRFFEGPSRLTAARSVQGIAGMARAFVVGNFLIGVILAVTSSIVFAVLHLPYPLLIGGLSGFLSLVPYAGIVLASLPPLLAAFASASPSGVLVLALLITVALHFAGMNVLYPILVGGRVHLNPLIVTLSLMLWGFLWDAAGLLLAIPITAGLKAVCDNVVGLRKYGRFLGD